MAFIEEHNPFPPLNLQTHAILREKLKEKEGERGKTINENTENISYLLLLKKKKCKNQPDKLGKDVC